MPDGATLRDHLTMAYRASGVKPEQLRFSPLPETYQYLWNWFCELSEGRTGNGFSVNALSWRDFLDWQELRRMRFAWWEIRAIRAIDLEYLSAQRKT